MAFIIKEHRPGRFRALAIVNAVLWGVSVVLVYQYGMSSGVQRYDEEQKKTRLLHDQLDQTTQVGRDMQARISILERTAQVDREAKIELARDVKAGQEEIARLREDVSFYKSIISPDKGRSGLSVYKFTTMPAGKDLYHFKMILTQAGKNDNLAEGGVNITVHGILNNQEKALKLSEIRVSKKKPITYKFHYYQEISGSLRFPEGFQPRDVVVTLKRKKGHVIKNPVKRFDWHKTRT